MKSLTAQCLWVSLSIYRRFLLFLAVSLSFDFIRPISAAICDISLLSFCISFTYLFSPLMWPLSFGALFPFLVYFFHSVAILYIMQLCLQRNSVGSLTSGDVSSSIFTAIWSNSLDSLTDGFFFTKLFSVLYFKIPRLGFDTVECFQHAIVDCYPWFCGDFQFQKTIQKIIIIY